MNFPLSTKPKITKSDIERGSIIRYFAKNVSRHMVTEISSDQYNIFKNNPYYVTAKLPWIIKGNLFPSVVDGRQVLSIEEQNRKIIDFYGKQIPELKRKLTNLLEFATPTINQP